MKTQAVNVDCREHLQDHLPDKGRRYLHAALHFHADSQASQEPRLDECVEQDDRASSLKPGKGPQRGSVRASFRLLE